MLHGASMSDTDSFFGGLITFSHEGVRGGRVTLPQAPATRSTLHTALCFMQGAHSSPSFSMSSKQQQVESLETAIPNACFSGFTSQPKHWRKDTDWPRSPQAIARASAHTAATSEPLHIVP